MAFQQVNVAGISPIVRPDLVNSLIEGYRASQVPRQISGQEQAQMLANHLRQAQLQAMPQQQEQQQDMNEARIGLLREQMKKMQSDAQDPFSRTGISGDMGQVMQLEAIKNKFGENSPVYQRALNRYNQAAKSQEVLNLYRQSLAQVAPKRFATPLTKSQQEIEEAKAGFIPGTSRSQKFSSPQDQREYLDRAELGRQKIISDPQTRQKALYASNIDKTLGLIDVDDLTRYAGSKGKALIGAQKTIASLGGSTSRDYINYQKAITAASVLAKQIRQFYGDSITPQVNRKIEMLANPASWSNNPDIAANNFKELKKIIEIETGTYRDALKNTKEFLPDKGGSSNNLKYNPQTGGFE